MEKTKEFILGLLAVLVLILYWYVIKTMISGVIHWVPVSDPLVFNSDLVWLATALGALIAGVVIANLAQTKPGTIPESHMRSIAGFMEGRPRTKLLLNTLTSIYIVVWLLISFWIIFIGVLKYPGVNSTLNEMGKSCVGIILGSLYAYFGIEKAP